MVINGLKLNADESYDWNIFFNQGTVTNSLNSPTAITTIENFLLNLNPNEYINEGSGATWDIRYYYKSNSINIVKMPSNDICQDGVSIGGFMVRNCNIVLLRPFITDDCLVYNRAFTDEFQNEFNKQSNIYDKCEDEYYEYDLYSPEFGPGFN